MKIFFDDYSVNNLALFKAKLFLLYLDSFDVSSSDKLKILKRALLIIDSDFTDI